MNKFYGIVFFCLSYVTIYFYLRDFFVLRTYNFYDVSNMFCVCRIFLFTLHPVWRQDSDDAKRVTLWLNTIKQ